MEHVTTCHLWFTFRVAGSNWAVGKCGTRDTGWSGGATRLLGAQFLLFQKVCTVCSCQETSNWYSIFEYLYELYYVIETIHTSLWVFCILNAYLGFSACSQQIWAAASCIRMVWCVRVSRVMVWRSPMRLGLCWIPVSLQMNTFCWIFHSCSMGRIEQKSLWKMFHRRRCPTSQVFPLPMWKGGDFFGLSVRARLHQRGSRIWIEILGHQKGWWFARYILQSTLQVNHPLFSGILGCDALRLTSVDGFLKSGCENPPFGCIKTLVNHGILRDIDIYHINRLAAFQPSTVPQCVFFCLALQLINLVGRERSNERGWPIEVMTQGLHDLLRCHRKMIQIEEMEGHSHCWNWRAIVKSSNFLEKSYGIY